MGLFEIKFFFLTKLTFYGRNKKSDTKKMLISVNSGIKILTKKIGKKVGLFAFFFIVYEVNF